MPEAEVIEVFDKSPQLGDGVYLATGVIVAGDVSIGTDSSIWFNAVVRADVAPVRIGERSNVQDGAVLHADPDFPCMIGDEVTIGHRAIVHGASIESGVTVGMGAIVLNGARVGRDAIVAAGAVVTEGSYIPPATLVAGVPAREKRKPDEVDKARGRDSALRYVENARRYLATGGRERLG